MPKILQQNLKEKNCNKCNTIKQLENFYFTINKKTKTKYYHSRCIQCYNIYDYDIDKNIKLKKAYGITFDQYNDMLYKQDGKWM